MNLLHLISQITGFCKHPRTGAFPAMLTSIKFILPLSGIVLGMPGTPQYIPPPGTVKIRENTFVDKRLISFSNYDEFLFHLKIHDSISYTQMIPIDTMLTFDGTQVWNNPKYDDYPVIGVNKAQMIAYCQWRSNVVNLMAFDKANRTCNFSYWARFDKIDASQNLRIKYTLPNNANIQDAPVKREKYWLHEMTTEGSYLRPLSTKISNTEFQVFRCVATYEVLE